MMYTHTRRGSQLIYLIWIQRLLMHLSRCFSSRFLVRVPGRHVCRVQWAGLIVLEPPYYSRFGYMLASSACF
jgi:hypothetical protein